MIDIINPCEECELFIPEDEKDPSHLPVRLPVGCKQYSGNSCPFMDECNLYNESEQGHCL